MKPKEKVQLLQLFGVDSADQDDLKDTWEDRSFEVVDPAQQVMHLLVVDGAAWEALRGKGRKKEKPNGNSDS